MTSGNGKQLIKTLSELFAEYSSAGVEPVEVAQVEQLLSIYYRHIAPSDLDEHDPQDLLGGLIAHWQLMRVRAPEQAIIRVYNPNQEEDGWRSGDTIVEVVARDMPFLVDSISAALNGLGLSVRFTLHPVFGVVRDSRGHLSRIQDARSGGDFTATEAVLRLHVDRQPQEALDNLAREVEKVVADVARTTSDWLKMKRLAQDIEKTLASAATDGEPSERDEARHFLNWMINDHFLFIGACRFSLTNGSEQPGLEFDAESGLGMLRGDGDASVRAAAWISGLEKGLFCDDADLMVTKANARSSVHRPAYMDCVAIKQRGEQGDVVGLYCLLGLFSSGAYNVPPRQIPLLRKKVDAVFEGAQVSPDSHSGRVIANILDTFPRDSLFQISTSELLDTTLGVLALQERQRTRLFIMRDPFHRFCTCLVYLPREHYSREVRLAIQELLSEAMDATDVVSDTLFSESILARIHVVLWLRPGSEPVFDLAALETRVVEIATTWTDGLRSALYSQVDESQAAAYLKAYRNAFPGGYREDCHPRIAVNDIQRMEQAREQQGVVLHLYHPISESVQQVHVRLYSPGKPLSLSQVIPILEHMGLGVYGERPYRIRHPEGDIWIHDFSTRRLESEQAISSAVRERFVETFLKAWGGSVDSDAFNGLVLLAGFSWREALLFRAYSAYLHQIKVPYTQAYIVAVLSRNSAVVRVLLSLFEARFDPDASDRETLQQALLEEFERMLEAVSSLDEDRILRSFVNLVQATLRTNFYQFDTEGRAKHYLSFKIEPALVETMPSPRPKYEIFVYSARMEGVHLRGGLVARGGLRWSDRMEDYRTEVLGLMKAQMVKNTVIVPVGSKGGFVVRDLAAADSAEVRSQKVVDAYRTLLRGMLDLTDNRIDAGVLTPDRVVRHDGDDPYLVIAADKGTATFSDTANELALQYGFWLGDAFASGGSVGYDHKMMGITARGAWESVKRNFRELGRDTQTSDFTVVGIGDMSGDVFGNGMLLSCHIRLLAAFNHRHIFLDPDPDAAVSYEERARLFRLPRSGWSDYDRSLISSGGGVYSRDAKSIPLSAETQQALGIKQASLAPSELIRALLQAPVDLLWNGGIGTYVKASQETDVQASDKSNDAVRVDADTLRCRVVGEGGNLGFTQLARVEFSLHGGLMYTDAIDNSAGVACSDREVNIKVLLDRVVANGDMTMKQRNQLLVEMTDDVARLVLADNYSQTEAISMVVSGGVQRLYEHARFMDLLELKGGFDRRMEGLPLGQALTERFAAGQGLTKPEVAMLLAYSKMNYYQSIVDSDVPDDALVQDLLLAYFPGQLHKRFSAQIADHPLRREIIATAVAGTIADHVGPGIGFRVREEVGSDLAAVTRAYLVASSIFETDALWNEVEQLDNLVPAAVQTDMQSKIAVFLELVLTSVLRNYRDCLDMGALMDRFHDGAHELWAAYPKALAAQDRAEFSRRQRRLSGLGVPKSLAQRIAGLAPMAAALDIVDVAVAAQTPIENTAWVYSALNHTLEIEWMQRQIVDLPVQTHWHLLARTKLQATLNGHRQAITAQILKTRQREKSARGILERWVRQNRNMLDRYTANIAEFKAGSVFDFAILSLVVARLGELVPGSLALGSDGSD